MALTEKQRQQTLVFVIIVAGAVLGLYLYMFRPGQVEQADGLRTEMDSLTRLVAAAKQDLAQGTIEGLRQRIADYEASVGLMRQLVPAETEVPTLLDDIASRALLRGVLIKSYDPQTPEPGPVYHTYRYRFSVLGHYDEIGEFLADVASLPRIIVPYGVLLAPAQPQDAATRGDTTGALLEAQFQLRTFVKPLGGAGGG